MNDGPDNYGFEDGRKGPTPTVDFVYPDEPDYGDGVGLGGLSGLSVEEFFSLIITGTYSSEERDMRLLWIAHKMKLECAPRSITELAMWLGRPRQTIKDRVAGLSECFQKILNP